jgi:arylsulfatase A-like enzyme/uncharacterized membrane protein YbhN (UPF0104 family)
MTSATKRRLVFAAKLAISAGIMVLIFRKVLERENAEDLWARIEDLHVGWIALAALAQLGAIATSVVRWDRLLVGQGIRASYRHLLGSFMVGRFFGAFTPGGWTGLNGYRLYDIARHTGKAARSTATIGIEMVLGQLAFGAVVIAGSVFGFRYIGTTGVILVDLGCLAIIATAITLIGRPGIFRWVAARLPVAMRTRVQSLVDAVCAYEGKTKLVFHAALLGMGTHAFNNLIYVSAARALGVELGVGEVFFVSSMQILATLLPISVGGVGLREAAAVSLYTVVGVPAGLAVLIPIVGIAVEYAISSVGGIVFVVRRNNYEPDIVVEDEEKEAKLHEEIEHVPAERQPRVSRGATLGLGAGVLAGVLVGVSEGAVVLASSKGSPGPFVLAYGAMAYALLCAAGGTVLGAVLAWSGRLMKREAVSEPTAYAHLTAFMVSVLAFGLGLFRIRRDVFHEQLALKSPEGLGVVLGVLGAVAITYVLLAKLVRLVTTVKPGRVLLRSWGSPVILGTAVVLLGAAAIVASPAAKAEAGSSDAGRGAATGTPSPSAQSERSSVLFIVVDTLRADRIADYGYDEARTPHLTAFSKDSIRFAQAFAQASWTRPSFASILTSRYASSHHVMAKTDALADELVTLPEALRDSGYRTGGIVTNYNVAPYYNFHQGFDDYTYLEPDYFLGADDTSSKLLLMQFAKRVKEKVRPAEPGSAYQDAATVNAKVRDWLDRRTGDGGAVVASPFFLFVAYMDPHDPYYEHPYEGGGYARAGHVHPDPSEAPKLSALYDGEITYWDEHFGQLVADLERRGLYEDLTIVVTSDHGEEFMDHGGFWHGETLYDEQVHVPLYLKLPGNRRGGTAVHHWVELIDVMPTLLAEAGIEVPDGAQGGNLFEGTDEVYAEEEHNGNDLEALRTRYDMKELKLITANPGNPRGLPPEELFRVDLDPEEKNDLSDDRPELLELAEKRLEFWGERAAEGRVKGDSREIDAAQQDKLRALGYAEE